MCQIEIADPDCSRYLNELGYLRCSTPCEATPTMM